MWTCKKNPMKQGNSILRSRVAAGTLNVLLAIAVMMLSRVVFYCENWSTFAPWQSWALLWSELRGALTFDLSAALYVNALYLVLLLLPWLLWQMLSPRVLLTG